MDTEQIPDRVQEYKDLEEKSEEGKPLWVFICPNKNCERENKLKGHPSKFFNRPFRCLDCNYVPLLGKEELQDFIQDSSFSKQNAQTEEKN
jgi:hypothetical protein